MKFIIYFGLGVSIGLFILAFIELWHGDLWMALFDGVLGAIVGGFMLALNDHSNLL